MTVHSYEPYFHRRWQWFSTKGSCQFHTVPKKIEHTQQLSRRKVFWKHWQYAYPNYHWEYADNDIRKLGRKYPLPQEPLFLPLTPPLAIQVLRYPQEMPNPYGIVLHILSLDNWKRNFGRIRRPVFL